MANLIGSTSDPKTAGVLGQSDNQTVEAGPGVHGISKASGVLGESETWHGVVGLSKSTTGGVGVYGSHIDGGAGVIGESKNWMGVFGKSQSTTGGAGVMGEGDPGPGVIGKSTKWIGVYGETAGIENGPAGVWGEHKGGGIGVKAISNTGVGLFAFSNGMAAVLHGNVDINGILKVTGNVTIQGVSIQLWLNRIVALENLTKTQNILITNLQNQINEIKNNKPSSSTFPQINVAIQNLKFNVTGSGFLANKLITIRVVDDVFHELHFQQSADSSGKLSIILSFPCNSGLRLHFSATDSRHDSNITGVLWSNVFTTICP